MPFDPKTYKFKVLDPAEQDDTIVATLLAQERDLHAFLADKARLERMLANGITGAWRTQIERRLQEVNERIEQVVSIIEAMQEELPPSNRLQAAKQRILQREKLARGEIAPGSTTPAMA